MNLPFLIDKPILLLDEQRCKNNIQRLSKKAALSGCSFRPHFKTHQSNEIGVWFRDAGVNGITVSSLSMAEYFIKGGWNDITIAFPFFPAQIPKLKELEILASLRLFIHSDADLQLLNRELINPFKFYIEINPGFGRSGIHFENISTIENIIKAADKTERCSFHGFYIHDGRTYMANNRKQIQDAADIPIRILQTLKEKFPGAATSLGDTPSASMVENFDGIDELTPGNFVFYDWMQVQIGSCSLDDVALFALLPVAQYFSDENRAILHGGATHLSKDFVLTNGNQNFGQLLNFTNSSIKAVQHSFITALSQEHGTLSALPENIDDKSAWICPIHSCLTANLHDHYITTDGKRIEKRILS